MNDQERADFAIRGRTADDLKLGVPRKRKVVIAGGRAFVPTEEHRRFLDEINELWGGFAEVFSGACPTGADRFGEDWAAERGIVARRFPADWKRLGKAAGPQRNKRMIDLADGAILLPGGRGTENAARLAAKAAARRDFRIAAFAPQLAVVLELADLVRGERENDRR